MQLLSVLARWGSAHQVACTFRHTWTSALQGSDVVAVDLRQNPLLPTVCLSTVSKGQRIERVHTLWCQNTSFAGEEKDTVCCYRGC